MVYLRDPSMKTLILFVITLVVLNLTQDAEAVTIKYAYTKPILGKPNTIRDRRFGVLKPDFNGKAPFPAASSIISSTTTSPSTTTPTIPQALAPTDFLVEETTMPLTPPAMGGPESEIIVENSSDNLAAEATVNMQAIHKPMGEDDTHMPHMMINKLGERVANIDSLPYMESPVNSTMETQKGCEQQGLCEMFDDAGMQSTTRNIRKVEGNDEIEELFPLPSPELLIAPLLLGTHKTPTKTSKRATTTTELEKDRPVPCTCGVFLSSQVKRSSKEGPEGTPVITNELDRTFPCNSIGQKQCQTKCLETIVQHIPNSANILCATLNRDCRKERAYLFVKNCRNQWFNTNLAAGKEYCCRDGKPYTCPLA